MKIPFFSFDQRNKMVRSETLSLFQEFFDSQWYVLGDFTSSFEREYAKFNKVNYSVGLNTGLDALHLSLKALGVKDGDEVILPSNTYIATVLAVSFTGATPIFVEPRIETYNINPDLIEPKITERTKCIMPVHLYGQACEMDTIMQIAERYNLAVIEDNAQAHGALFNGKLTGSFGHINATSFYPTKNLGALGEAGAITTDSKELASKVSVLRNYGSQERYYNEVIGYNNRIDEFEAAYLKIGLNYLSKWNIERAKIAELYFKYLKDIELIVLPQLAKGATTVNHLFVIRTHYRDQLRRYLAEMGIGTQIHYPVPPHLQKAYAHLGYKKGDLPIAEKLANTSLSLPIYPGLAEKEISYVATMIRNFFKMNLQSKWL